MAAVFGVWLAALAYALWPPLALRLPRPPAQAGAALLAASALLTLAARPANQ